MYHRIHDNTEPRPGNELPLHFDVWQVAVSTWLSESPQEHVGLNIYNCEPYPNSDGDHVKCRNGRIPYEANKLVVYRGNMMHQAGTPRVFKAGGQEQGMTFYSRRARADRTARPSSSAKGRGAGAGGLGEVEKRELAEGFRRRRINLTFFFGMYERAHCNKGGGEVRLQDILVRSLGPGGSCGSAGCVATCVGAGA